MNDLSMQTAPEFRKPLMSAWVDRIFLRLHGRFGNQFFDKFRVGKLNASGEDAGIENAKQVWAGELAGYTQDEIVRGLAERYAYGAPSCDDFKAACRPPINPESAFNEAVAQLVKRKEGKDTWSHPAIYWTAQAIGSSDMLTGNWQTMKGRWTKELADFMAESNLPDVPAYAVALPPPGQTTVEPEEAKARIAAAAKSISAPVDYKAWAKKLIAQEAAGLKPNARALDMAREVMGVAA